MGNSYYRFCFYFVYLISAQLPFFIILWSRNFGNNQSIIFVCTLLIISIIINITIFSAILYNLNKFLKDNSHNTLEVMSFEDISQNKLKESLSDFFAIFLLPFFTFNFSSDTSASILLFELFIIFLLLTIFLFRTNNLTANILIYLIFNVFACKIPGKNLTIISENSKMDLESDVLNLVRIFDNFYLFSSNVQLLKKRLMNIITILIALALAIIVVTIIIVREYNLGCLLKSLFSYNFPLSLLF